VQAHSFTSAPIAEALVDAHKHGVNVQVVLEKSRRSKKDAPSDFVHHTARSLGHLEAKAYLGIGWLHGRFLRRPYAESMLGNNGSSPRAVFALPGG